MNYEREDMESELYENGADLIGHADLSNLTDEDEKYGVSIAVKIPKEIVISIKDTPNRQYYEAYKELNQRLDSLAVLCENYLKEHGYHAFAQTTDAVVEYDVYRTRKPHKTVATLSGLGWIGKSALFVTKEYGSAIRLTSVITDANFNAPKRTPISQCGDCMICANACPGKAISGESWNVNKDRDEIFNPLSCRKKARELAKEHIVKRDYAMW